MMCYPVVYLFECESEFLFIFLCSLPVPHFCFLHLFPAFHFSFLILLLIGLMWALPPDENTPFMLICELSIHSVHCLLKVIWDIFIGAFALKGI